MSTPLTLVFDFSSPYGYLAVMDAPRLAEATGHELVLRPYLMGAAMKLTGTKTLPEIPIKGPYSARDMQRSATRLGLPIRMPAEFPFLAVLVSRVFYALEDAGENATDFALAAYRHIFQDGVGLAKPEPVAQLLTEQGLDAEHWLQTAQSQDTKDKLRAVTDDLIQNHGCWGSPHYLIDDEMYWGFDKRHEIEAYHKA